MEQTIILYQATKATETRLKNPIKSTIGTWLGEGFYFWEHHIENAEHWGETHYNNRYHIYKSCYSNNEFGFDFVDNYEHRDDLIRIHKLACSRAKGTTFEPNKDTLNRLISSLLRRYISKRASNIKYIRIETGSFYPMDYIEIPVIKPKKYKVKVLEKRLVQVCFLEFPCKEVGLTSYEKVE